jgi:hypothetical protein
MQAPTKETTSNPRKQLFRHVTAVDSEVEQRWIQVELKVEQQWAAMEESWKKELISRRAACRDQLRGSSGAASGDSSKGGLQ